MTFVELEQRSHKYPIVLYDGFCFLCDKTITYLIEIDKERQLRYHTLESENTKPDTVQLFYKGQIYERSDVLVEIAKILKSPSFIMRMIKYIPKSIRDLGYRIIAKNRYRIWGKSETCLIPQPDIQQLFLHLSQKK